MRRPARWPRAARPLDADAERQVGQAVFDALFGLGGFQPLPGRPRASSRSTPTAAMRCSSSTPAGRRERAAPVAGQRRRADRPDPRHRHPGRDRGTPVRPGHPGCRVPLPGGGRLFAVMAVTGRPCVAIRRDRLASASLADLIRNGTLDRRLAAFLAALVKARKNILVSGGTAVGKTTLLRALASAIPPRERLITIEDSWSCAWTGTRPPTRTWSRCRPGSRTWRAKARSPWPSWCGGRCG